MMSCCATEAGVFLTAIGAFQIIMNACIAPWLINRVGAAVANVIATIMQGCGIMYPLIELLGPQLLMWWISCWGWAIMQPSLSTAVGAVASPWRRGAAMGFVMGSMALARGLAPFVGGALFELDLLNSKDFATSQAVGLFEREARDPSCVSAAATNATGCVLPRYTIEFRTTYSVLVGLYHVRRCGRNRDDVYSEATQTTADQFGRQQGW